MRKIFSIHDARKAAGRRLPDTIFQYLEGGADDEWSRGNNESAFDKYELSPRYLRDVAAIDTETEILGVKTAAPIILSPTGMSRLFHHDKELAVAKAAEAAGLVYTLSTLGTSSIEEVAEAKPGPKMFQIYIHKDRSLTEEFVDRAKAAGYAALCLTVDTPLAGNRERDKRTGFEMPPRLTLKSLAGFAMHPGWTLNLIRNYDFRLMNVAHRQDALAKGPLGIIAYVNSQFDRSVTWDDAAKVIDRWGGPFVVKGVQSTEDAVRSAEIGASALMISNHGGRQLEGTPAPIDCVRPIREAVGDKMELIVDGGVRRGIDIIRALALGANAVSIGRPYLYGLSAGGQAGVEHVLSIFKTELERSMALLGCAGVKDIDETCLFHKV